MIIGVSGSSGSGKSFMAAKIAANAQKMGIDVVYFDAESAISSEFRLGSESYRSSERPFRRYSGSSSSPSP